jgi:enoyl-CoA hydratase
MSITTTVEGGVAELVMERPPVNALDTAGWRALAAELTRAGDDPAVHVVVLRANGRGCNAVPVIAAVHGYCLGGGIGLCGNADLIVAASDASFGLPEVDRGALGAATHLARLVPQHKMRAMVYTGARASATELHAFGSVHEVVAPTALRGKALELARVIAAKSPTIIRAAKQSLNGIDPVDVRKSYRYEQGFTYELHLSGVADEARRAFVEKRPARFDK